MKVGDCVKVDWLSTGGAGLGHKWIGICTWTDGYKFEFLIDGELDTWTKRDLKVVGAEVINENR